MPSTLWGSSHQVHKVIPVSDSAGVEYLRCVPASAIICKCVYIAMDGMQVYVVTFVNQFLGD